MKKYLSAAICLFILFSCKEKIESITDYFKTEKNIHNTVIELEDESQYSRVWKLYCFDNKLVAYDVDHSYLFSITDLNKKEIVTKFGKIGQGPDEILGTVTSTSMFSKNAFSFFEPNKSVLYMVNFEDITSPVQTEVLSVKGIDVIMTLTPLSSNLFIATGIFERGRYLLLDKTAKVISYNFDYPTLPNEGTFTHAHKAMAFQGDLGVRPDGERFFSACEDNEVFEIIEITSQNELNMIFKFHGELGDYKSDGDGINSISAAISKFSKTKFIDSYCTQNYIYLLYSNRAIENKINNPYLADRVLVFDWDGKPVKILNLDAEVNSIAVDEIDQYLYAYCEDIEQIIRFDLK